MLSEENVATYAIIDQWDDIYSPTSDNRVACEKCTAPIYRGSNSVLVECVDCLSTPGVDDCICPRDYGLDNAHGVATQDWQEHEYRDALMRFDDPPTIEQDIWMQSTIDYSWSLLSKAQTGLIDLTIYLRKKFDLNIWTRIASYYTQLYYYGNKLPVYVPELLDVHAKQVWEWIRLQRHNDLAYDAPMRGYCLRCGEPAINNRCVNPVSLGLLNELWTRNYSAHARRLSHLRTIKYGLGIMGVCHRCMVTGYQYAPFSGEVTVANKIYADKVVVPLLD